MGKEKILILFAKYSVPTIIGMLFLGLNTIIDGFFVGQYIGTDGLACVNICIPFISLTLTISVVIGTGTQSIIGRRLGEKKISEANMAFVTAITLISGITFLLFVIALVYTSKVARFLGANEMLLTIVATYISYLGIFLPFFGLMMVFDYVLKVMAKPLYAMAALITGVISHITLNYLFIVQLNLGIKGAALATGLSYMVSFIMAIIPFLMKQTTVKLFKGYFDKTTAWEILYNGSSEGLSEIGTGITVFLFNITLMQYADEVGVAAFAAISYLSFIGMNILLGLSDAVGAIVSYNYGSGNMFRVKKILQITAITAFIIGVGFFIVITCFTKELITIFLDSCTDEIIAFAINGAKVYAFAFLINGLNIVASGYFTAIGNPKNSALIALSKGIIWIIIGIVILPKIFGIMGVWLTVPLAELMTVFLSMLLVYKHFKV